jgi:hypothetical protein
LANLTERIREVHLEFNRQIRDLRFSYEQGGDASTILEDIRNIEADFSGLLGETERAELSRMRTELEAQAPPVPPPPTLQEVFEPSELENLGQQAVRLTWDFTLRETGAWRAGDWILFSGGLRVPEGRTTDEEFWNPDHALQLSLGEPLDLERPFILRLLVHFSRSAPGQSNELALELAGLNLVFEDDKNRPSFAAGRGDPAKLLAQVRAGPVAGFSGFTGFPDAQEHPLEITIEVHPKRGDVKVSLNGQSLRLPRRLQGPLPEHPLLSLRSRQPIDVLQISLEAERLRGRR